MLARLPGLESLDVVATENVLAAGFHERVHDLLPGIEEESTVGPAQGARATSHQPVLVTPPDGVGMRRPAGSSAATGRKSSPDFCAALRRTRIAGRAVVFQRPAAVSLPGAIGVRRCRSALSGPGLAAARRGAVRRGARRGLRLCHRGRESRIHHRFIELAALAVPGPHGHTRCRYARASARSTRGCGS